MIYKGIEISGVTSNSKLVKPGYAFVAVRGESNNGNKYINQAIEKGAALIITDDETSGLKYDAPVVRVSDSRYTLGQLACEFNQYPATKLKSIGITGTNGKTTTTFMVEHILRKGRIKTGLIGTTCIKSLDKTYVPSLTTPSVEEIQNYLGKMVKDGVNCAVIEASSHGLKQQRLFGVEFDCAIHTNISLDHINYHRTFDDYLESKKILFNQLKKGGFAIINSDDKNSFKLLENRDDVIVIDYGLNSKATITASSLDIGIGSNFTFCQQRAIRNLKGELVEPQEFQISLNVLGKHNVYNALGAITCGILYGVKPNTIKKALSSFTGVDRRIELIYNKEISVIDDFSHNPGSYQALFETIQQLDYTNLHMVCAIRGNRGKLVNTENAKTIVDWSSVLNIKTIVSTNSMDFISPDDYVSYEERRAFISQIEGSDIDHSFEENLESAIEEVLSVAAPGDLIVLTGAQGMSNGRNIIMNKLKKKLRRLPRTDHFDREINHISNLLKIDN